jgi:hypothetical protein
MPALKSCLVGLRLTARLATFAAVLSVLSFKLAVSALAPASGSSDTAVTHACDLYSPIPPTYIVTPGDGNAFKDKDEGKMIAEDFVKLVQHALADRVEASVVGYYDIKDCEHRLNCEVIFIVEDQGQNTVRYEVRSKLGLGPPGRPHTSINTRPSCGMDQGRTARECRELMLRVLARLLVAHDSAAHRAGQ